MPGVPTGRGCEACRRQKKKCDQAKPACSRCDRLRIPCVGAGQRRYKFIDESAAAEALAAQGTPVASAEPKPQSLQRYSPPANIKAILREPSNPTTVLTRSLVSLLEVTDSRYAVRCYGTFMTELPGRLGHNPALDAALGALTSLFPSNYTHYNTPDAAQNYGGALTAMRSTLSDPALAKSPDTLCAMYLLMVCQGWMGKQEKYATHGEAMAYLLSIAVEEGWKGQFESDLLITLCVPVILEKIFVPDIQLEPWLSKLVKLHTSTKPEGHVDKSWFNSLRMTKLARLPEYIERPETCLPLIAEHYEEAMVDFRMIQQDLSDLTQVIDNKSVNGLTIPESVTKVHVMTQGAYGVFLTMAMVMNIALRAATPEKLNLFTDSHMIVNEIVALARDAARYRPLGSGYVPMCLLMAWASTDDPEKHANCEAMMEIYHQHSLGVDYMHAARLMKKRFQRSQDAIMGVKINFSDDDLMFWAERIRDAGQEARELRLVDLGETLERRPRNLDESL